jgi:hypothetical protein
MRTQFVFAATVSAAAGSAIAPPRIELNLANDCSLSNSNANCRLLHHVPALQHDHAIAGHPSVQDYTQRCPAKSSDSDSCPLPTATAFDHHQNDVSVDEKMYLIDNDGKDYVLNSSDQQVSLPLLCGAAVDGCTGVDYNVRSTYLIKYDAMDDAGNRAEQLVFALMLDDIQAPQIQVAQVDGVDVNFLFDCNEGSDCSASRCTGTSAACSEANSATRTNDDGVNEDRMAQQELCEHYQRSRPHWDCEWVQPQPNKPDCFPEFRTQGFVQAATSWRMCGNNIAIDNVDGDVDLKYTIKQMPSGPWLIPEDYPVLYDNAKNVIDTLTEGTFQVNIHATDNAGNYGEGESSNTETKTFLVTVEDTRKPWITVDGFGVQDDTKLAEYDTDQYPCDNATHTWGCETIGYPLECGTTYSETCTDNERANAGVSINIACEEGAMANDKFDDALNRTIIVTNTLEASPINQMQTTNQVIDYTATDEAGNTADQVQRIVSVRDTTPPVISLNPCSGDICTYEAGAAEAWVDPGGTCTDICDPTPYMCEDGCAGDPEYDTPESDAAIDISGYPKWDRVFGGEDGTALGNYTRTYKCRDASDWITTKTRIVQIVDTQVPVITLNSCASGGYTADPDAPAGESHCLVEAALDGVYTEPGASCEDQADGARSMEPPTGTVDLSQPGETFVVTYSCEDSKGLSVTAVRYVTVKDTTPPQIVLAGQPTEYAEAGFPYVDPMSTCRSDCPADDDSCTSGCAMDNIDGDISEDMVITDATQTVMEAFSTYTSCGEILTAYAQSATEQGLDDTTAPTGWYTVTVALDGSNERLQKVWCDMTSGDTFFPLTNAASIQPYFADVPGSCADVGMSMGQFSDEEQFERVRREFGASYFPAQPFSEWQAGATMQSTTYICMIANDASSSHTWDYEEDHSNIHAYTHTTGDMTHAVPGDYVIYYSVQDSSDNWDVDTQAGTSISRTLIVRDTMRPVIVMTLGEGNSALQHVGHPGPNGLNGVENPAGHAVTSEGYGNPFISDTLMAEQTSMQMNGWTFAACASAVTGLVLLAYSKGTNAVQTSVPV